MITQEVQQRQQAESYDSGRWGYLGCVFRESLSKDLTFNRKYEMMQISVMQEAHGNISLLFSERIPE